MIDPVVTAGVIGLTFGGLVAGLAGLVVHERREFRRQDAKELKDAERERLAVERHGALMAALDNARALTLGAINQRARLEIRAEALERAINDHANHLEQLGRVGPSRVTVGEEGR